MLVTALDRSAVGEPHAKDGLRSLREDGEHALGLAIRADDERFGPHFAHRDVPGRGEHGRVERLRLPHAGPRRQDHQVARLEAAGQAVEVGEAGGDAGDLLLALVELLDGLEGGLDDLADVHEGGLRLLLGDGEDAPLGVVEELPHFAGLLVALRGDGVGGLDHAARERLLVHDGRVVDEVRGRGDQLVEQVDEVLAPDRLVRSQGGQLVLEGDAVDGLAAGREGAHGLEHLAMRVAVEVLGLEQLEDLVERGVVEQNSAQDAPLGVQVLRRDPSAGHRDRRRADGLERGARVHANTLAGVPDILALEPFEAAGLRDRCGERIESPHAAEQVHLGRDLVQVLVVVPDLDFMSEARVVMPGHPDRLALHLSTSHPSALADQLAEACTLPLRVGVNAQTLSPAPSTARPQPAAPACGAVPRFAALSTACGEARDFACGRG